MAAPTLEEKLILRKFRKEILDLELNEEDRTDLGLLRWLRARDLDILKASEMLRKSLEWRKAENLEHIFEWTPPENYGEDYDYEIVGTDAKGRPIIVVPFGVWDLRKAISGGERELFLRYMELLFATVFLRMRQNSKRANLEVTQFIVIADCADLSIRQLTSLATVDALLTVVRSFEANYPESLYNCYTINASRIFSMLFALVKPLLSARTLSKVQIYTTPSKWKPVLLKNLPHDQIPMELGGTRGGRRVSIGGTPHRDRSLHEGLDFITLNVGAGQKLELEYAVLHPNTKISWKFKTDGHDIGFSITRDRQEEVLEYKRYDSHINQEIGELVCDCPGEYFIIFDNSYSMLRGKVLHYLVETIDPEDDDELLEVDEKLQTTL